MPSNNRPVRVLDDVVKNLDPNSYRKQLIDAARHFKSNWVEFSEYLTKVASEKLYLEWGYRKFEDYCKVEIKIKKNTAMKLTNAYFFITQGDPDLIQRREKEGIPELEVVNFLQKVKTDENCAPEVYDELKQSALDKEQSGSTLARKFKELIGKDGDSGSKDTLDLSLSLIDRLRKKMKPLEDVPSRFDDYLAEMEEYLKTTRTKTDDYEEN
ncbi:MAG: hypothetical protein GY866_24580 [Proteobacteria bacterium]|nr:hypothetical protein [Pseudomonadota bacterium]